MTIFFLNKWKENLIFAIILTKTMKIWPMWLAQPTLVTLHGLWFTAELQKQKIKKDKMVNSTAYASG